MIFFLGVDSPFFSAIVLFKSQLFPLGFRWFSGKKDGKNGNGSVPSNCPRLPTHSSGKTALRRQREANFAYRPVLLEAAAETDSSAGVFYGPCAAGMGVEKRDCLDSQVAIAFSVTVAIGLCGKVDGKRRSQLVDPTFSLADVGQVWKPHSIHGFVQNRNKLAGRTKQGQCVTFFLAV